MAPSLMTLSMPGNRFAPVLPMKFRIELKMAEFEGYHGIQLLTDAPRRAKFRVLLIWFQSHKQEESGRFSWKRIWTRRSHSTRFSVAQTTVIISVVFLLQLNWASLSSLFCIFCSPHQQRVHAAGWGKMSMSNLVTAYPSLSTIFFPAVVVGTCSNLCCSEDHIHGC